MSRLFWFAAGAGVFAYWSKHHHDKEWVQGSGWCQRKRESQRRVDYEPVGTYPTTQQRYDKQGSGQWGVDSTVPSSVEPPQPRNWSSDAQAQVQDKWSSEMQNAGRRAGDAVRFPRFDVIDFLLDEYSTDHCVDTQMADISEQALDTLMGSIQALKAVCDLYWHPPSMLAYM